MNDIKSYKQEIPFVRIILPFSLGIISFYNCSNDWILSQLTFTIFILFSLLLVKRNIYKYTQEHQYKGTNGLILHLLFFLFGSLSSTSYNNRNSTDYYINKNKNFLKVSIIDEPQIRQNIILFNALISKTITTNICKSTQNKNKHSSQVALGKIRVLVIRDRRIPLKFKYGDELIIPVKLVEIPPPSNPSEFDFKSWQASQNIYYQTTLKQRELIKLSTNTGNRLISYALELRKDQVKIYRKLVKDDDAFAVAATLILGYRTDLSTEILNIYSKTGTIHVLSVSGMHVALVYLVLNRLLWLLNGKLSYRIIKTFIILLSIWLYAMLTGLSPSVLRASIMISTLITARLFVKNTNSYNIIAFAAFCMLLYNPYLIWDIGFQLSFMAVLGLIYLQPKIEQCWTVNSPWLAKLWSLIAMSLAAQLATYPFSVYYFHQFPLYFLASNLFITLPSALIIYIGLMILIFRVNGLGSLFEWIISFMNTGLEQIANLPFSGITSIWLNKIELTLLCISLTLMIVGCVNAKRHLFISSFVFFLFLQYSISYDKLRALHQKKIIKFTLPENYAYALIYGHKTKLFTNLSPTDRAFNYSIKPTLDQHRITQIIFKSISLY